ncbi:MAG TPA: hypothetical protein VNN77_14065 [candidate division Zixibacteria bacterium]|nr:hypothetical protein [candidate division Zixibacteria bacterium]
MRNIVRMRFAIPLLALLAACTTAGPIVSERQLVGTWYVGGDRNRRCEIVQVRGGLEARNERGSTTPLVRESYRIVLATAWEGGLRGELRGDRIEWANGTYWTRSAR